MREGKPTYRENKDYESNLAKIRVEEGWTILDLAKVVGTSQAMISGLQNGMVAPHYLTGKKKYMVKPVVKRLLKVLNASLSDLFPRYICDIRRGDLLPIQINEFTLSQPMKRNRDLKRTLYLILLSILVKRERKVLILRYYEGYTLEETANVFNISRERIRQIEARALRKLRKPEISKKLKPYYINS